MSKDKTIAQGAYDQLAEYYFTYVDTKPYNAYYERPAVLSMLPEVQGKRVLDAACAAGWYTKWLIDQGASVTALDVSAKMVEATKRRVGDGVEVRQTDLNKPLDFLTNESFDLIISSLTLHYLEDWTGIMSEFHRILKPAGILVFSVHHPFMDFTYFNRENYFATELLEDEWKSHEGKVTMHFYRRPLCEIIRPVLEASFNIDQLLEPMPTEKFKETNPKAYEKLTKHPQFLFVRAVKR